jgi:hypothetical protein
MDERWYSYEEALLSHMGCPEIRELPGGCWHFQMLPRLL